MPFLLLRRKPCIHKSRSGRLGSALKKPKFTINDQVIVERPHGWEIMYVHGAKLSKSVGESGPSEWEYKLDRIANAWIPEKDIQKLEKAN